jgi:hypothetical protein
MICVDFITEGPCNCRQGAGESAAGENRPTPDRRAHLVRTERECGTDVLVSGVGYVCRQAAGLDSARTGGDPAPFHELASTTTPPRCGETRRRPPAPAVWPPNAGNISSRTLAHRDPSALLKSNVPVSNWVAGMTRRRGSWGSTGVHDDGNTVGDHLDADRHRQSLRAGRGPQHAHQGREMGTTAATRSRRAWRSCGS